MNKLRQVSLKSGKIGMTAWVDDKPELQEGVVITLKTYIEPERKWEVEKLLDGLRDEKEFDTQVKLKHVGLWKQVTK